MKRFGTIPDPNGLDQSKFDAALEDSNKKFKANRAEALDRIATEKADEERLRKAQRKKMRALDAYRNSRQDPEDNHLFVDRDGRVVDIRNAKGGGVKPADLKEVQAWIDDKAKDDHEA